MRAQDQLLGSRARVTPRYAVLPLEGIPFSRLPEWPLAHARVLAGPALGAGFAEYLLDLEAGHTGSHPADGRIEFFFSVLSGSLSLTIDRHEHLLGPGGYAFAAPSSHFQALARQATRLLLLRKVYEPAPGIPPCVSLVGDQVRVAGSLYYEDTGTRLQELLPSELSFDMAMNIFTFDTGHSLPITETHVMEHGLYVLQGKGVYFLGDAWMEVEATDFIWMGPYCPQSYYATGPEASRYIYYKNVNREIPL